MTKRPTIRVKPHDYQPNKAELEEPVHIPMTMDQLAKARPVSS